MVSALTGKEVGGAGSDINLGSGRGGRGGGGEQSGGAGHPLDGRLHMGRLDDLIAGAGRFDPGRAAKQTEAAGQPAAGAGQQVQRGGFDGLTGHAHRRQALLNILADQRSGPRTQTPVAGDAREEGAVLAQACARSVEHPDGIGPEGKPIDGNVGDVPK